MADLTTDDAERDALLRLCHPARVQPNEMWDDPQHGLCVSLTGLGRMTEFAPDQERAQALLRQMEALAGPGKTGLQ